MAKRFFPETLFVKRENAGSDEEYLAPSSDIQELAELGETVAVAEYAYVRTRKITAKAVLEKPGS